MMRFRVELDNLTIKDNFTNKEVIFTSEDEVFDEMFILGGLGEYEQTQYIRENW
jgi:hypothetical protein